MRLGPFLSIGRPAHDALHAGLAMGGDFRELSRRWRIERLEDVNGRLLERRHDRMREMIFTPAPDLEAFAVKLEIAYEDWFAHESEDAPLVGAFLGDMRRLAIRPRRA